MVGRLGCLEKSRWTQTEALRATVTCQRGPGRGASGSTFLEVFSFLSSHGGRTSLGPTSV